MKLLISLLIILVSIIYGLPNIVLLSKLGEDYTPLVISGGSPIARDEAFAYAPFVNYILKGHFFLKEAYVLEYANFPTPYIGETVPSLIIAALAKMTGSIERAFIVGDFIFPPIIFILIYSIGRQFIKNKLFCASASFLTVISRDLIALVPYPVETLKYLTFAEGRNYLLFLSRSFHPQLTLIFFLMSIIMSIGLLKKPESKVYMISLGIFFGILFYSYFFYFTYFSLFFIFMITYFLIKKDKVRVKSLFLSGCIAFVISSLYFINYLEFSKLSLASDFIAKTSLHNLPLSPTLLRYLILAIIFFVVIKPRNQSFVVLFLVLLSGIIISPLSKIIVGQDLETFHYIRRALMPVSTIVFLAIIFQIIEKRKYLVFSVSFLIIAISLMSGLKSQLIAAERIKASHYRDESREFVFALLRQNTNKDSVVGSLDTTFNSLLPIYTNNRVYFPPTDRTITPTYEGVERYAILANILGIEKEWQKKNLINILSYLFVYQAYSNQNKLDYNSQKRFDAEKIIDQSDDKDNKKYALDYIVVAIDHLNKIKPEENLKAITSVNEYVIFKVVN